MRRAARGVALALTLGLVPSTAAAEPSTYRWAFGSPEGETALAGLSLASLGLGLVPQAPYVARPDRARPARSTSNAVSHATGTLGGAALLLTIGSLTELAHASARGARDPMESALRVTVVDLESALFAGGATLLLKRLTGRCRPRDYDAQRDTCRRAADAFPSGHVAPVAAIAGARLGLALGAEGDTGARLATFALAEALAATTGFLRVHSGAHSWDDVLGGAVLGHAIGLLTSLGHGFVPMTREPSPSSSSAALTSPRSVISLGGVF
jgi:membrane-associated phospholipid phosphatase